MRPVEETLSLFEEAGGHEDPLFFETRAREAGYNLVAGVDEAGRGPLAGPVVAAAVILPAGVDLPTVVDSKLMSPKVREAAFELICREALAASVGVALVAEIDAGNILQATLRAMRRAVMGLPRQPDMVLVDGNQRIDLPIAQRCLIKGDRRSRSISAASVIAKVYRDRIMRCHHDRYPLYGFDRNQGYGTRGHLQALAEHGPCPQHRRTFRGVKPAAGSGKTKAPLFRDLT